MAYLRLMRFDKPVGIALLWFPTAWALWIANHGSPPLRLILLFLFGTICMRAAGCVINDIADRHIDKHVSRTKYRPLTTGEVSLLEACVMTIILLGIALSIVIQLPITCFYYALPALGLTLLYPFCKRFFQAPQLILGLCFSMGIPMAYSASNVLPDLTMLILLMINFTWIVAYDTMYAMVDRLDDQLIGVYSTAILFGSYDRLIILCLQLTFHSLWLYLANLQHFSIGFYYLWLITIIVLIDQQWLIRNRKPPCCFRAFLTNGAYGLMMWLGLMIK